MIRLFEKTETSFNHNKHVLKSVLSAIVIEEANGPYELELEVARGEEAKLIEEESILVAPTANGNQPFRVYKRFKTLRGYKLYARHIFYDLMDNFLEDVRPTNQTGAGAIDAILSGTQYPHLFTGSSDILTYNTSYYIRQNPVQAMLGNEETSVLKRWGGEIKRNGFQFSINGAQGLNRGYTIRLGKNLVGIEEDMDLSGVATRIYPTVVLDDLQVYALPEKYIDSPLIGTYSRPYIREIRIDLTDAQRALPMADIYTIMRDFCQLQFDNGIDLPKVNYKVDFVQLQAKNITEWPPEYKYTFAILANMTFAEIEALTFNELEEVITRNIGLLSQLDLYDTIGVRVHELDINVDTKVIRTEYDCLRKRYSSLELGSFRSTLANQRQQVNAVVEKAIKDLEETTLANKIKQVTDLITGANGGYVIMRYNSAGQPYEMLIMDNEDINLAVNVWRWNVGGLGFSSSGYNGPYETAITSSGDIVADFITAGTLNAGIIKVGLLQSLGGGFWVDMVTGYFNFGDRILSNENGFSILLSDNTSLESKLSVMDNNISAKVSATYVDDAIAAINQQGLNLVSNLPENWEVGTINSTTGANATLAGRIRTTSYYPVESGSVTVKTTNTLYQSVAYIYDANYNFVAISGAFSNEYTFTATANRLIRFVLRKSDDSAIAPADVTDALIKMEQGDAATTWSAYPKDLGVDLSDVWSRIESAEVAIQPNNITATVENRVEQNGSTVLSTKSELQATSESLTQTFSRIGTVNLLRDSNNFITTGPFDGTTVTLTQNQAITSFGITDGTRILTTVGNGTSLLKALMTITARTDTVEGEMYSLSVYVKNNRNIAMSVRVNGLGPETVEELAPNEEKRLVFTGIRNSNQLQLQFRSFGTGYFLDCVTARAKVEKGVAVSDWSQAQNEMETVSFKFSADGFELKDNNGASLITPLGVANSDNFMAAENVASGFPLRMPFRIDPQTSSIAEVILDYTNQPFRTYSTGASSGGGSTSGSGGSATVSVYDWAQGLAASTSSATITQSSLGSPHGHNTLTSNLAHRHAIPSHAHSTPNHTHGNILGIIEQAVSSNGLTIYVDGVWRADISASAGQVNLTQWLTTPGAHNVEIRSATLKRVAAQLNIKSYIRR